MVPNYGLKKGPRLASFTAIINKLNALRILMKCDESALINAPEYDIELNKGSYGLGVYFIDVSGAATVDPLVSFYRLPDGTKGPGEESGLIQSGDILVKINGESLLNYEFKQVVEILRKIPEGKVTLRFQRAPLSESESPNSDELKDKEIVSLKLELEREKKCRDLLAKKVNLYREEIIRLQNENAKLRNEIEDKTHLYIKKELMESLILEV